MVPTTLFYPDAVDIDLGTLALTLLVAGPEQAYAIVVGMDACAEGRDGALAIGHVATRYGGMVVGALVDGGGLSQRMRALYMEMMTATRCPVGQEDGVGQQLARGVLAIVEDGAAMFEILVVVLSAFYVKGKAAVEGVVVEDAQAGH